jgi:NAD(P)-dependent dehydrogenase (short-subunit alcohol dehydrogenase family)
VDDGENPAEERIVDVAGKVMVVVGGGNGMGRHVVLELLRRGARVAAVDVREESLAQTATIADAGEALATFVVDITDQDAVEALPARVAGVLGEADGLLNVAGIIQPFVRLVDLDEDVMRRVLDVNLYGTLHTVRAFLPRLLERPEAHVANVASMGGFLPVPGQTVYGASKAAVKLMTEGLYAELLETQVGVSLILPGAVRTEITANSGVERPTVDEGGASSRLPITEPEEAARTIVDGIESDQLYVFVGRDSRVMNLLTRAAPRASTRFIQRQMRGLLSDAPTRVP